MIRVEQPGDREQVANVVRQAFGREDEVKMLDALRQDPSWIPDLAFVAERDGKVVGHTVLTRLAVGQGDALALAPVAVDPAHHGHGIGTALVRWALASAESAGERMVVVLGEPRFYARFGFRPAAEAGVTGPFAEAGEAFAVRTWGPEHTLPAGAAAYPSPFGMATEPDGPQPIMTEWVSGKH